jgi:hypothetical protein
MLRLWLLKLFPFLSRWIEVAPACCGVCASCMTTTAGSLLLPVVTAGAAGKALSGEGDGSRPGESAGELRDDRQVGVKRDALDTANT